MRLLNLRNPTAGSTRPQTHTSLRHRTMTPSVPPSAIQDRALTADTATTMTGCIGIITSTDRPGALSGGRTPTSSAAPSPSRSEEHTSELQSHVNLVCRLLLEKKKYHPRVLRLYTRII